MKLIKNNKAFTLIELLVIIAVIAIISISVYLAVSPGKRIDQANNAVRAQDSQAIEKAIKSALLDNTILPTAITDITENTRYSLVTDGASTVGQYSCGSAAQEINRIDIAAAVEPYIGGFPIDPEVTSGDDSGYYVVRVGNLFDVESCNNNSQICGNNIVEGTEVCDDGNTHREKCGDGVLQVGTYCDLDCSNEYVLAELCDYNDPASWLCTNNGDTFTGTVVGAGTLCIYGGGQDCEIYLDSCGGVPQS